MSSESSIKAMDPMDLVADKITYIHRDTARKAITDTDRPSGAPIVPENANWEAEAWDAEFQGVEDFEPEYDYVEIQSPSSDNGCSNEELSPRPILKRAFPLCTQGQAGSHREWREEQHVLYEEESSGKEDALAENVLRPSYCESGDIGSPWDVALPGSPTEDEEWDVVGEEEEEEEENNTANTPPSADVEKDLAQALQDSIASLKAEEDAAKPDLDATTLQLMAHVEAHRFPGKTSKTHMQRISGEPTSHPRHHVSKPKIPYPFGNPLSLSDVETSSPITQHQQQQGKTKPKPSWYEYDDWYTITSADYLNDGGTAVDTVVQDLKALAGNLASHHTTTRQRGQDARLEEELLEEWLERSIATTEELIKNGKRALANKASEMVGRVLAGEKGVGVGVGGG